MARCAIPVAVEATESGWQEAESWHAFRPVYGRGQRSALSRPVLACLLSESICNQGKSNPGRKQLMGAESQRRVGFAGKDVYRPRLWRTNGVS